MPNIITFDIEEWSLQKDYFGNHKDKFFAYDTMLERLLELLDEHDISATFFCLGRMAEDFPEVIKSIHGAGHEIGCHSYSHQWLTRLTPQSLREDTHRAVSLLENLIGEKVESYRAPAFSICKANEWAFDILATEGIRYDSSVFPALRDFGGYPEFKYSFPCMVDSSVLEFPIPVTHLPVIRKTIAFSGGGYFRLLPRAFIAKSMRGREYNMCYFHIADLLPAEKHLLSRHDFENYFKIKGSPGNRIIRHVKSNIGRNSSWTKLSKILSTFDFISIRAYGAVSHLQIQ